MTAPDDAPVTGTRWPVFAGELATARYEAREIQLAGRVDTLRILRETEGARQIGLPCPMAAPTVTGMIRLG